MLRSQFHFDCFAQWVLAYASHNMNVFCILVLFFAFSEYSVAHPFYCDFTHNLRQKQTSIEEFNSKILKLQKELEIERKKTEEKFESIEQVKLEIKLEIMNQVEYWESRLRNTTATSFPAEIPVTTPASQNYEIKKAIDDLKFDINKYISKFKDIDDELNSLRAQNKSNIETIEQLNHQLAEQKNHSQLVEKQLKIKEQDIWQQNETIRTLQDQGKALRQQVNSDTSSIRDLRDLVKTYMFYCHAKNCMSFGSSSSSVLVIDVQGSNGTPKPVKVLCNARIAGPGWTVVQRRFNGSVDFNRNWIEYQNGFGSVEGEFFLGLENLYLLTKSEPHELYIELESFDNQKSFARYNHFAIGSADDDYALNSLGEYSGTAGDSLESNLYEKFSTYDHDRDSYDDNCARKFSGGWWFSECGFS